MRIGEVKKLITDAVLAERERCAKVALTYGTNMNATYFCIGREISDMILAARPPSIRVIRPETALKNPEALKPGTIVAGQTLDEDDNIVGRGPGARPVN